MFAAINSNISLSQYERNRLRDTFFNHTCDMDKSTLAERLRNARKQANLTQKELAKAADVSQTTISDLERGRNAGSSELPKIAAALRVSVEQLSGISIPASRMVSVTPSLPADAIPVEEWDNDTPLDDDEVAIPFFKDFELACGNGNFTEALSNETRKLRFSKLTLRRALIQPESVFACTASGNSMQPVINPGATVFVNRGMTSIQDGKIYAVDHGGVFRFKYIHRLPMGGLKLSSANSDYVDEVLSAEDVQTQNLVIIGQAFSVQNWL